MSTEAASHPDDVSLCHQIMDEQQTTITGLQQRMGRLEHYVEQLLRSKYGPRSERIDPNQLQLFDDDVDETGEDAFEIIAPLPDEVALAILQAMSQPSTPKSKP